MRVGGSRTVNAVLRAFRDENIELWMKEGLTLKIQIDVGQPRGEIVDPIAGIVDV